MIQRSIKAVFWMLLRLIYRVRVRGKSNIPDGAAILTPNHVSFIDAMLIAAHIGRPIHFAMHWKFYRASKWLVAPMGAFPIASKKDNRAIYDAAFDQIAKALDAGELLCIFPEGMITKTGEMNPFRDGLLKILARNPVPVVPVGLRGLWGSYFSKKKKGFLKLPDHFMAKIEMVVGAPLPPDTPLADVQEQVQSLL